MRDVSIVGIGQTKVGGHWGKSLRDLAVESLWAAMADAGVEEADALYVGNMLGGQFVGQEHLGTLIALTMITSAFGALTVMPLVFVNFQPKSLKQ